MPNDIVKFRKLHKLHEAVEFTIFLLEIVDRQSGMKIFVKFRKLHRVWIGRVV